MTKSRGVGRGGSRPGSGPKPKPKAAPAIIDVRLPPDAAIMTASDLAKLYVVEAITTLSNVQSAGASETARVAAARTIMEFAYGKPAQVGQARGKKGEREEKARAASTGKFAPPAPPKLAVDNTR